MKSNSVVSSETAIPVMPLPIGHAKFGDFLVRIAQNVNKSSLTPDTHIKNVYAEGELKPEPTIRNFRIVQKEGEREVA